MADLGCPPNAATAFDYLVGRGLRDFQAAAIIGNLQLESRLDPSAAAIDTNGLPGRGIAMWQPPRWQSLLSFAAGRDPWALDTQLDFLWNELQTDASLGLTQLSSSTTLEGATVTFQNLFEKPKASLAHTDRRIAYAQSALFACPRVKPPPIPPGRAGVVVAAIGVTALVGATGYGVYRALAARKLEPPEPDFPPAPPYFPNEKQYVPLMKRPAVWLTAGGAVVSTVLLLTRKSTVKAPTSTTPPPQTYGETTKVTLSVPAGWRRVTGAEVSALPELVTQANALIRSPGFTTMQYGTLTPFTASDGNTYATWVEQHYHEPGGPGKPWGLHHGATLLAQDVGAVSGLGLGYLPPALDVGQATVYDFLYVWDGRQWQIERAGYVVEADVVDHPDRLDSRPFSDVLNSPAPPYRIVSRYYLAEQQGNRFWQHLGMNRNY